MEEKLYFKPANYGKGRKKEQAKQKSEPKTEKDHKVVKLAIVLLILAVIVAVIIWLLRGKTTTAGRYPENVRNESLECVSKDIVYPKAQSAASSNRELKLSLVFRSSETLNVAGLRYTNTYTSKEEAKKYEALSHAEFNIGLGKIGFDTGKFENKFTILDNVLEISLHATSPEITEDAAPYFLLENLDQLPTTLAEYRTVYEAQGFACTSTLDN